MRAWCLHGVHQGVHVHAGPRVGFIESCSYCVVPWSCVWTETHDAEPGEVVASPSRPAAQHAASEPTPKKVTMFEVSPAGAPVDRGAQAHTLAKKLQTRTLTPRGQSWFKPWMHTGPWYLTSSAPVDVVSWTCDSDRVRILRFIKWMNDT